MKKDLVTLLVQIGTALLRQLKSKGARLSIILITQNSDEMLEINIDKVDNKITMTKTTGGDLNV